MSEWINATPLSLEREVKEVNGVLESSLTPEAESLHRHHLEEDRQRRIAMYRAELFKAAQALDLTEERIAEEGYRLAAD